MKQSANEEIVRTIIRFLSDNAEEDEMNDLKRWVELSDANKKYYQQIKNIWEITVENSGTPHISAEKALESVLHRIKDRGNKPGILQYWQRIAAILLIPVVVGSYIWIKSLSGEIKSNITYNEIYATFGTRSAVKLADGSKVWLNSGSSLRYPDKFYGEQRQVYLLGEAYFEVKSDKSHPFIVKTPKLEVKATGTKFNVSAYKSDNKNVVTLLEGKVAVITKSLGRNNTSAILKPMQTLVLDTLSAHSVVKETEDVYRYIAWKDGKLVFRNEPLSEVVRKISQFYNVEIEVQDKKLNEYRYRATFQDESLEEILKLLKLSSPVNFREIPRNLRPDGTFSKKKIIIYPL